MEKQFDLILTNRWKATGLIIAISVVNTSVLMGILSIYEHYPVVGVLLTIM